MSEPEAAGIAVVGPTASGKSTLAIDVARRLRGEIISMDSRQVYRGMDLGTAKPTPEQRRTVPHHGLDLADPAERFSAGRFARYARRCIEEIRGRGNLPILVGGTGFFLRALTHPIFREPEMDAERRALLQNVLAPLEMEVLERWLSALDPDLYARLAARSGGGGRQRILRALEVALLTGRPLSWWQRHSPPEAPPVPLRIFVLDPPRDALYRAIDRRVDEMLSAGLLDEARSLRSAGYGAGDAGMNATGYAELLPVLDGDKTVDEAAAQIRGNTRAYARRQLTWLRHQLPPGAIWLDPTDGSEALVERIVQDWSDAVRTHGETGPQGPPSEDDTNERQDAE